MILDEAGAAQLITFNFQQDTQAREAYELIRTRTCKLGSVEKCSKLTRCSLQGRLQRPPTIVDRIDRVNMCRVSNSASLSEGAPFRLWEAITARLTNSTTQKARFMSTMEIITGLGAPAQRRDLGCFIEFGSRTEGGAGCQGTEKGKGKEFVQFSESHGLHIP